jgi:glycosyltransferase involved in cell wall biosynthesis
MTRPFRVVALVAAYNEEDIIEACLEHLCRHGVESYLLDDGSTDRTAERAASFLERGLIAIEPLPQTSPRAFSLERILARKEQLAASLDASWFINQDADEFRDSLWSELDLLQAFERVDRLGWNAIDFEIFTIRPVGEPDTARAGPNRSPCWYEPPCDYDRVQVRAWKQNGRVDLRSSGGHDVSYEGRMVFPLRFPMRHYPIRSRAQGVRKVFTERLPAFDPDERNRGWHVQYDRYRPADSFVAAQSDVLLYDAVDARVRSALRNRDLEAALARVTELTSRAEQLSAELQRQQTSIAQLEGRARRLSHRLRRRQTALVVAQEIHAEVARELALIHASRSWRWTQPLRSAFRLFGGR